MFKTVLLVLVIGIVAFEVNLQTQDGELVKQVLAAETEYQSSVTTLHKQIDYWQQVVIEHPNYRDGYLLLAILNTEVGKKEAGQSWLKRVYLTDPNYLIDPKLAIHWLQSSQ